MWGKVRHARARMPRVRCLDTSKRISGTGLVSFQRTVPPSSSGSSPKQHEADVLHDDLGSVVRAVA